MDNNRNTKRVEMGKMNGENWKGRPYREWLDDIKDIRKSGRHTSPN